MGYITKAEFSEFVKNMRMSVGLDQDALAYLLKIPKSHIKKYEECKKIPDDPYAFEYDLRNIIKWVIKSKKVKDCP